MISTLSAQSEKDEALDLIYYAEDISRNAGVAVVDALKEFTSIGNALIDNAIALVEGGSPRSEAYAGIMPEDMRTAVYWAEGNQVAGHNIFAEIYEMNRLLRPMESRMEEAGRIPDHVRNYIAIVRQFFLMKAMTDMGVGPDTIITAIGHMGDNKRRRMLEGSYAWEKVVDFVFTDILSSAEKAVLKMAIKHRIEREYLSRIADDLKGRIAQQVELLYNGTD